MEIKIGDYGRMLFENFATAKYGPDSDHWDNMPEHWRSIAAKAIPLIQQLIALNDEMVVDGKPGGYKLTGHVVAGKKQLTNFERIRQAQKQLWGVQAKKCKEGDLVWLIYDHDMYIGQNDPCTVEFKKKGYLGVEVRHMGGYHIDKIPDTEVVLRAPKDWEDNEELYTSDKYWLEQADKLGL
jgi:hypothetical protein